MSLQSRQSEAAITISAFTIGAALAGVIMSACGHKAGPNFLLGGLIGTSACGAAIGYCEARAGVRHSRELEARRLANRYS